MAEFQKSVEEIRMKQQQEDAWVKNKLLFLGALLAGFIVHVILSKRSTGGCDKPDDRRDKDTPSPRRTAMSIFDAALIRETFQNPATLVMLAAAFAGSLITDMQIRSLRVVINENGLWLSHYVEPIMIGVFTPAFFRFTFR
jgi:hypothetical protein